MPIAKSSQACCKTKKPRHYDRPSPPPCSADPSCSTGQHRCHFRARITLDQLEALRPGSSALLPTMPCPSTPARASPPPPPSPCTAIVCSAPLAAPLRSIRPISSFWSRPRTPPTTILASIRSSAHLNSLAMLTVVMHLLAMNLCLEPPYVSSSRRTFARHQRHLTAPGGRQPTALAGLRADDLTPAPCKGRSGEGSPRPRPFTPATTVPRSGPIGPGPRSHGCRPPRARAFPWPAGRSLPAAGRRRSGGSGLTQMLLTRALGSSCGAAPHAAQKGFGHVFAGNSAKMSPRGWRLEPRNRRKCVRPQGNMMAAKAKNWRPARPAGRPCSVWSTAPGASTGIACEWACECPFAWVCEVLRCPC